MTRRRGPAQAARTRYGFSAAVSAALHASVVVLVLVAGRGPSGPMPPIYRVDLIASPAGPRAVGVVPATPQPKAPETPPAPIPRRAQSQRQNTAAVTKAPAAPREVSRATATPDAKSARRDEPAPLAGGGPVGGTGTDVTTLRTDGVEFPYPAYLNNIINQIALRFNPRAGQTLRAEVVFLIRRDGSVADIRLRRRSGNYLFDLEATGSVEAAGKSLAFGPLPDGWADDVLTVIFEFSPKLIR